MSALIARRGFVAGIGVLFAAPAIVRAESLMRLSGYTYRIWQYRCPILPPIIEVDDVDAHIRRYLGPNGHIYEGTWTFFGATGNIYSDEQIAFTKREITP